MFALPRVLESGELEFDPAGPIPKEIPFFVKTGINTFMPDFDPCIERGLTERPLTSKEGCLRRRKIWWCAELSMEVTPIICKKCEVRNVNDFRRIEVESKDG